METTQKQKDYQKEYYQNNKNKLREYGRKWNKNNPGYNNKIRSDYYKTDKWKAYQKEYYQNNKNKLREYGRKWREINPGYDKSPESMEKRKEYNSRPETKEYRKDYYQKHKEKLKEYAKKWSARNSRNFNYTKKYNITLEEYNKILRQQNNKCAICENGETNTFKGKIVYLSVDHNWETGKVRGLLCKNCNVSLGNLKEDISLFYKCIEYLKEHNEKELKDIDLKRDGIIINYSLTNEEYNKRLEQQNKVCAICKNYEIKKVKHKIIKLSLDHNWKTGQIRSLLCKNCNTTLGNLKEDISLFYKCIEYLKKHN